MPETMTVPVRINGRDLKPHKATVHPMLGARTVLTNSPWDFVSLWLKRERKEAALFFWNQARSFTDASRGMPIQSAPLLHYYAFMNATKALLSAKGVPFDERHGIGSHNMRGTLRKITLSNEGVRLLTRGVASSLSQYLGEPESSAIHSLEELLFNIPCIHRTYCLTYKNQSDLRGYAALFSRSNAGRATELPRKLS
jgi:YaaC-like Protein